MELSTKEELIAVITELQGQMGNIQEQLDKLAPVTEEVKEEVKEEPKEEMTEQEISEIDKLLQAQ